ncbi:ABC transporter permease [Micromonospora sp. CB01531]|uniref:ABC transporter permease n=1 Tax=Micromonospora sp. CB01531 TaxID=1718947 RepID=UPI00093DC0D1|nr:ABC transporter permease [Micromonospora sp. CB01531]OKI65570.1 hypothetical protein A6A27_24675 [Micromonospora sp. CB01531]
MTEQLIDIPVETVVVRPRRRVRKSVLPIIGGTLLLCMLLFVIIVPLLPGVDPLAQDLSHANLPPFTDSAHLLGTDSLGRDTLSRIAQGGRTTIAITLAIVVINVIIGATIGLLAGFFGGWIDRLIGLVSDAILSLPVVLLLIAISAIVGPSATLMVVVLGCTFWMGYARVARAVTLSLRGRDFIVAPQILGASASWTIRRHVLPHVVPPVLILAVTDVGVVMLLQAGLDFLGLGVQPPAPTWGGLILQGQPVLSTNPWQSILPGLSIFILVAGTQLLSQRFTAEGSIPLRRARTA